jgi:hypothetical protein
MIGSRARSSQIIYARTCEGVWRGPVDLSLVAGGVSTVVLREQIEAWAEQIEGGVPLESVTEGMREVAADMRRGAYLDAPEMKITTRKKER